MVCPNCGSNVSDKRTQCERCGTDLVMYKKIIRTSNFYYNNGLARAKVHDLSGAVIALRKCLELNKLHTSARNLLGLTYFAMGETVSALSEWVISKHFQPANNDADDYIHRVQSNPTRLDTLNQAIKRYNSALNYSKQGSEDLAIIQLKKVVTLNPNFIRAYQLLALLHMKLGENERAKKYLTKASKIDVSNTITLKYMGELEKPLAKDLEANPEAEQSYTNTIIPISSYKEDKPNIMAFVNLVIGVLIGLAFMAVLGLPAIRNHAKGSDADNGNTTTQTIIQQKDNEIKDLNDKNNDLKDQVTQLESQLEDTTANTEVKTTYDSLIKATGLYITESGKSKSKQDFNATADTLASIDDTKLEGDTAKNLLKTLRDAVYPDVAKDYYHDGYVKYNDGKYEDAIALLLKVMKFDPKDENAVYFVARSYDKMDDNTNAAKYYNQLITDFPDTSRAKSAKQLVKNVQ